ncbi:putative tRNA nucleotidyl transferase [Klebsiella phage Kp7]|uniref:tRNA nucleotidyl transferase n=1 Tax=Klebsiella phage Kp7 TaxID=2936515 RepID=A0AAE9KWS9_9CAUD|nr:putative tRNA nucleotidyl transferase [Klebsiella phage Kp7]
MSIQHLKGIHHLVKAITEETFFIAGGAVVDTLYGKKPKDYDCILPVGGVGDVCGMGEIEAFHFLKQLSSRFRALGYSTKVYQSYGLNLGESVDPRSFQANFVGCMKVDMRNCQLDLLLSKHSYMSEHVMHHDCNMNMVWFNGERICWEHGGNEPKVSELIFCDNIPEDRKERMRKKWALFQAM